MRTAWASSSPQTASPPWHQGQPPFVHGAPTAIPFGHKTARREPRGNQFNLRATNPHPMAPTATADESIDLATTIK